jgi:hypothetical protein
LGILCPQAVMLGFLPTISTSFPLGQSESCHCSHVSKYRVGQRFVARNCRQPRQGTILIMSSTSSSDNWKQQIQESIKKAEEATQKYGKNSKEAAAAWDAVEELDAEASHQRVKEKTDPLEKFCDESPEADECRVYDN